MKAPQQKQEAEVDFGRSDSSASKVVSEKCEEDTDFLGSLTSPPFCTKHLLTVLPLPTGQTHQHTYLYTITGDNTIEIETIQIPNTQNSDSIFQIPKIPAQILKSAVRGLAFTHPSYLTYLTSKPTENMWI